ncbi:MAG: class I SAM-dependent methyltransferase [Candidatus Saccharimonadales bacterium]
MNESNWWKEMFDQKYLDTYLGNLTAERTKAETNFIIKTAQLSPSDVILDLACGHGRHSIELAQRGFAHVSGLDYSEIFINKAEADAQQAGVSVRFMRGDMKELPFDSEFDAVLLMFTAFGYFDDDTNNSVLRQINKSLKSNGRFYIDVVSGEAVTRRFECEGVPDKETGLPKIARQVEMSGHLTDESEWYDKNKQVLHSHREWQDKGEKKEYDYFLHVYTMPQYEHMLTEAGFVIDGTWGDTRGNPFNETDDSSRTIILAKKAV